MKRITIDEALEYYIYDKEKFKKLYYMNRHGFLEGTALYTWDFQTENKGTEWYFLDTTFYKEEEEKFYLFAEGVSEDVNTLYRNKKSGYLGLSIFEKRPISQIKFTEKEIYELPEWCQYLEWVPVEELEDEI